MGKRHNIDTIAEVLIDKLNDMERTALKIETASKRELKIDTKGLEELFLMQNTAEKTILSDLEQLQQKNKVRLPNWVLGVLFAFFLGLIGSIVFAYSSVKKVEHLQFERDYYKEKVLELQKS
jgi:hypothetical protein